ncbi:MAG: hypothetical protein ACXWJS_10090 [Hyphomicrobium sp.]
MRSPVWFVVAAVIAVAGFAGAVLYLVPRLAAADAGTMRVVVPGNAMLMFDKPGPYVIYHEKKSTVDGRYYASDNVDGLSLGLTADATGAQVKLVEPKTSTSYTIGNCSGTSIYAFTLDQPGRYRLSANLASGRSDAKAVLAIDQGMVGALLRTIFGAIAIAFAGLGIAGAIVFAVLWQRSKAKRVATG